MLPNLSTLPLGARAPSSLARRERAIRRGATKTASKDLSSVEARWKAALKMHFGNDLLADGIGYRCWHHVTGLVLEENHYAWDEFQTYYGDNCIMVSTRALQDAGFTMGHGERWEVATYNYSVDAEGPWDWNVDWVIRMWIWAVQPQQRDRLREHERWSEPSANERALLARFEAGEWNLGYDEEKWNALSTESHEAFGELFESAFDSAPWWVLRYIREFGADPELLEFTSDPPRGMWNEYWTTKMLGCILALQQNGRVVYALPEGVKPGSPLAQRIARAYFKRFEL